MYVGFEAVDRDVWSFLEARDAPVAREDALEVFFNTHSDGRPYYNIEINAIETVYDAFSVEYAFAGHTHRWKCWDCKGLKKAVTVRGTCNHRWDEDEGWSLEVAIPFNALPSLRGKTPSKDDTWTFLLGRYNYSVYLPTEGREISCYPMFGGKNFHRQQGWARLEFVDH